MLRKLLLAISLAAIGAFVVYAAAVNIRAMRAEPSDDTTSLLESQAGADRDEALRLGAEVDTKGTGRGMATLRSAAREEKYAFTFFYRDEDERTREMRELFDDTMNKVADRAECVVVNTGDPSEMDIVRKYGVYREPMPFVLAVAPNGAVTRGLPRGFNEEQLMSCFVSPCMEKCLRAVQNGKLVLVCIQNDATRSNDEAMEGVRDFRTDKRFSRATEVVSMDPTDPLEAESLKKFGINPKTDYAVTLLLAPPGRVIGRFKGATDKDELAAVVMRGVSGCGSGCGSSCGSSCGPVKFE
jgi:hypothetical protein